MPMMTDGAWPPPHMAPAFDAYRDWDAWYVGNPDRLRAVYTGRGSTSYSERPSLRARPGQYAGGVVGAFSRWLWGAPPPRGQRDGRLHVPAPADVTRTVANLLFAEPPSLTAANAQVQARLEQLMEEGFTNVLKASAEICSALGDVYLRPIIDREVFPDHAFLAPVHADGAIPVIRWGKLIEVTFFTESIDDNGTTVFRLLEHHSPGWIEYGLFQGTRDALGRRVPLTEHAIGRELAPNLDDGDGQRTGLTRLDVVRITNPGTQKLWRKSTALKYLGPSDFDGAEQWFDSMDETWTAWMRDIRLARGRIIVPEFMLESNGPGRGATFDADREVFTALNAVPGEPGSGITVAQFEIRWQEHKATADEIFGIIMRNAGLSAQTLGEQGDVAMTATEAQARERLSFITRDSGVQQWGAGIPEAVELLLEIEAMEFDGPPPERPDIEFGDSVSDGPETIARTVQMLDAAGAISEWTKLKMVHPDWDEPQIQEELDRIDGDRTKAAALIAPPPEDSPPAKDSPSSDDE